MGSPVARFKQTISYAAAPSSVSSAAGKPTFGAQTTAAARIQPVNRTMRDAKGEEFIASHLIYTAAPITTQSGIWLAGDTLPRRARRVDQHVDGAGTVIYRSVWL